MMTKTRGVTLLTNLPPSREKGWMRIGLPCEVKHQYVVYSSNWRSERLRSTIGIGHVKIIFTLQQ